MAELWYCDPQENTECRKTSCYLVGGPCHLTKKRECALVVNGEPLKGPDIEGVQDGPV